MVKYAIYLLIFAFIVSGAYCAGYAVGSANTKIEYITKEVVRYVEVDKAKSAIYSAPNLDKRSLISLMYDNKL